MLLSKILVRISSNSKKKQIKLANIIINGISIELWIDGPDILKTLAGWCKLYHISTENFTIGILIKPIIAITEAGFSALKMLVPLLVTDI